MHKLGGIWVPDEEAHLSRHLRETPGYADAYDAKLIAFALEQKRRRVALDVGANVGLWSRQLMKHYDVVHAFEPLAVARKAFERNVPAGKNVLLHHCALGDRDGTTQLTTNHETTFKTYVRGGNGDVYLKRLDSFSFENVDFIKIDCEGFDYYVLQGALETLLRCMPAVVFEAKPNVSLKRYGVAQDAALNLLLASGYVVDHEERGNFCCTYKGLRT